MITPILLFAFPALQEPALEPNQEIVVELTEAQTEFLKHAQAWHTHPSFQLEGAISMSMDFGNGSTPLGTLSVNCQFMRIPLPNCEIPHQGFSNIDGTLSMMGMEQEIAMTFMSDGEGIWQIDHMEKIVFPSQLEEDDLAPIFPGLLPLEFWLNELKAKDVPAVEKVADKEKPKQYGLRCEMDGATITMWFNEAHEILSLSSVPGEGAMGMPELD
ncbi:MAG: hypothetical protein MK213_07355, partial [Planctomycetes bacterium]|nr:hypothetical protein [Planctomycetota bacterium]